MMALLLCEAQSMALLFLQSSARGAHRVHGRGGGPVQEAGQLGGSLDTHM